MTFLDRARRLESRIASRLDRAARELTGPGATEPLETIHAVLELMEREVRPSKRGQPLFPFDRITLTLIATTEASRTKWQAFVLGKPSLQQRIESRLSSAGCATAGLEVTVAYAPQAEANWRTPEFNLEFEGLVDAATKARENGVQPPCVELTIVKGTTEQATYSLAARRIHFGRGMEVRDGRNRLIRTNQVAFTEGGGEANDSVSRQHAHVGYDAATGQLRLFDDGSAHGSGIIRDGRTIAVPSGTRGVRLASGDEIVLGEALVRLTF